MAKFPYFRTNPKRVEKLSKSEQEDLVFDLINAFALVKDPLRSALLLQDLLTASEIKNLGKRLRIAKRMIQGRTHEEIVRELHCSYATTSKVKVWLGEAGEGLRHIIKKLPKRKDKHKFKQDALGYYDLPQIIIGTYLNVLEAKERKRVKQLLQKTSEKNLLYKNMQEIVDEEFIRQRERKFTKQQKLRKRKI